MKKITTIYIDIEVEKKIKEAKQKYNLGVSEILEAGLYHLNNNCQEKIIKLRQMLEKVLQNQNQGGDLNE